MQVSPRHIANKDPRSSESRGSIPASEDPGVLDVSGDLSQPGTGAKIVDQAMARFGRIDTLVNNAGVYIEKPFTDYTDADYDLVAGVNLRGFYLSVEFSFTDQPPLPVFLAVLA
ncbi:SDR family oxidoreductase [Streptomyces sp. NPDC059525]|uniref:SDR family oxidoreductase n=1 Tax=Streptomyces sp. NPDC059525 TaxID=3346857 RepID=UPI0036AA7560